MKVRKNFHSANFTLILMRYFIALALILMILKGCSDKKESSKSCTPQLNEEKYQTVVENTDCSEYEWASGYMGMAGLSFSNFLQTGASDNITKTLGITSNLTIASDYTSGNRGYITKAICLVGSNDLVSSSRCNSETKRTVTDKKREQGVKELSMFALVGDLLYLNYGVLDTDLNGDISSTETNNFSDLQTTGVSSSGDGTTITTDSNTWEFITSTSRYIYSNDVSYCKAFSSNFTIIPTSSNTDDVVSCAANLSSVTELRPIFKLDNMTDITGGENLTPKTTMVDELSTVSSALDSELELLGMSDNHSLRKSLTNGLLKIDNGGKDKNGSTCTNAAAFDIFYLLVKDAADNSTKSTASNLHDNNTIKLTDLTSSVDSSVSVTAPSAVSSATMTYARLIYASNTAGTSHTDSYESAHTDLYTAIKNVRSMGTETSSQGDGKVIFRELICAGDN